MTINNYHLRMFVFGGEENDNSLVASRRSQEPQDGSIPPSELLEACEWAVNHGTSGRLFFNGGLKSGKSHGKCSINGDLWN